MAKLHDYSLEVSEFELHPRYNVHFQTNILRKGMNSIMSLAIG